MSEISIKDVVSLAGSPGLYKVIKSDSKAIVVESIDEQKKRQLVKGGVMASKLLDVSIYTTGESEPLINVLRSIQAKFAGDLPVDGKSDKQALMKFMAEVLPSFDAEKVYPSNIKKLVSWYQIIQKFNVDLTIEEEAVEPANEETKATSDNEIASESQDVNPEIQPETPAVVDQNSVEPLEIVEKTPETVVQKSSPKKKSKTEDTEKPDLALAAKEKKAKSEKKKQGDA